MFIGSHVADALTARGHAVTVLDDLSGGLAGNVPAQATFVEGSVTDADLVRRLFASTRFDHVYHLAAYAAEGLSHFIKRVSYTNTVLGSVNLINEAVNGGGARQNIADRYRNVIGIFMNQLLQGLPVTIFGDGQQTRLPLHRRCGAPDGGGHQHAGELEPGVNVGADQSCTLLHPAGRVAGIARTGSRAELDSAIKSLLSEVAFSGST